MFWEGEFFEGFGGGERVDVRERSGIVDLEIEVEIRALGFVLVELDGDGVFPGNEVVIGDEMAVEDAFVEAHGNVGGEGFGSDFSFGEAAAEDFFSVEEDEGTIIAAEI